MIEALEASIRDEKAKIGEGKKTQNMLRRQIDAAKNQLKVLTRQKIAELMRKPDQEKMINETYDALEAECYGKMSFSICAIYCTLSCEKKALSRICVYS